MDEYGQLAVGGVLALIIIKEVFNFVSKLFEAFKRKNGNGNGTNGTAGCKVCPVSPEIYELTAKARDLERFILPDMKKTIDSMASNLSDIKGAINVVIQRRLDVDRP